MKQEAVETRSTSTTQINLLAFFISRAVIRVTTSAVVSCLAKLKCCTVLLCACTSVSFESKQKSPYPRKKHIM